MGLLEGKRILVTGGSRGIGAGVVRVAMQEGAQVAFIYRNNVQAAQDLARQMMALYPDRHCASFQCDVADVSGTRETVRAAASGLGGIDVLVNNAGITRDATLAGMRREQWDEVIATNLGSVFNATQPLILQFVKQRSGSIINMTSLAGVYGNSAQTSYAASKAGIIGFTKALSKEIASFGVRVNAVAPGLIETDMLSRMGHEKLEYAKSRIPNGRLGSVDDVAHLVCFLASDRARYITGQVIQVDGGLVL